MLISPQVLNELFFVRNENYEFEFNRRERKIYKYFSKLENDEVEDWFVIVPDVVPDGDGNDCLTVCSKNAGNGLDPPNFNGLPLLPLLDENDGGCTISGLLESMDDWKRCDELDNDDDCDDIDDEPNPPEKPSDEFLDGCFLFSRRRRWSSLAFSSIFSLASLSWAFNF